MGSYIQIDSISIDLSDSVGKRDLGKCEHFSIRGYVSEIRKKDWKICWPFPVHESEDQPSLPPLDVPKYRCWRCQNIPQEIAAEDIDKDEQTDIDCCSTGRRLETNSSNAVLKSANQQDPVPGTLERRNIDLNSKVSCVSDFLPFGNEKEKKAGVVLSRRIDLEIGLEDNLNQQVTSVLSPKISPSLIQEVHTTKRGCEGDGASDVELAGSLKCMDKSSAEVYNGGTPSEDNRCQKESTKPCAVLGEGPTLMDADNITYDTTGHPPQDSVACNHTVPAGSTENMVENDFQDHHLEKSTALSRRRPRKVRLMTDLLSENGELKIEQITIQGSPSHGTSNASAASQARSIFPVKVDTRGDLTFTNIGQSRKRKLFLDEAQRPMDMCVQRVEIEASKENAKTIDTFLSSQSKSKDVPAGMGSQDAAKGYWSKSEIERNQIMGKRKNKKIQVIDNQFTQPHKEQQREDKGTVETLDKALSSRLASRAFTGKGMDNFPSHAVRPEYEFNLSKGKGKMLQTDAEMDSLRCQKNDMRLEDSFAYSGDKIMSNMPVVVPIPSAQGALNAKGLEEGLHLSLNSYVAAQAYNKKCIHQMENQLPFPLPSLEGTSNVHQPKRKDSETNAFGGPSIPSKHMTNAVSGKGVRCEENTGGRNTGKTVEAVEQLGVMKRYSEETTVVSDQGAVDDIPMEIVELLAKNQYERCLPDVENRCSVMDKSTIRRKAQMTVGNTVYGKGELSLSKEGQKEKHQGTHKKNSMATRGENVKPSNRKPVHYFSPFDGNNLGMNSLCLPQSPFGFEVSQSQKKPSNGFQFSPMGSSQLGNAQNCKFTGSLEECGSFNATSQAQAQAQGGCSLHKTILQQDDEASRIWASLTSNHVSIRYDVPKKVVSHPTGSNVDITSLQSGTLYKQNMKRDIDLNCMNLQAAGLEKLTRNTGPGTLSKMNAEYQFPCKHNGIDAHQNLRGSLDMYSNDTIPAMHLLSLMDAGMQSHTPSVTAQTLRRPSYPGDCSTKLEIGTSKAHCSTKLEIGTFKAHGTLKRRSPDTYSRSYLSDKPHGCFLGSPTYVGSSSSQDDMKFIRATGFNGQNLTKSGKKERMKSSNSAMQNRVSKQCSWPHVETEMPVQRKLEVRGANETLLPVRVTLGSSCMVNRNPADFTMPETGNAYMIKGEDLKFERSIPKKRPRIPTPPGCKQQRNLKGTKMKERPKH